jgi:hypothetical protein
VVVVLEGPEEKEPLVQMEQTTEGAVVEVEVG